MKEPHLTAEDLSKRWNVPLATLSQWRWNGYGPKYIKLGKHIVYRLKDVELFEEQKLRFNTATASYELAVEGQTDEENKMEHKVALG